jgi:hypothetical protein
MQVIQRIVEEVVQQLDIDDAKQYVAEKHSKWVWISDYLELHNIPNSDHNCELIEKRIFAIIRETEENAKRLIAETYS